MKLFSLFSNMKVKTSVNQHGIGLGLTKCKMITNAFGGHIQCQSVLNQGTAFTVNIPVSLPDVKESEMEMYASQVDDTQMQDFGQLSRVPSYLLVNNYEFKTRGGVEILENTVQS